MDCEKCIVLEIEQKTGCNYCVVCNVVDKVERLPSSLTLVKEQIAIKWSVSKEKIPQYNECLLILFHLCIYC